MDPYAGVARTLGRYCQLCDDGDFEAWGQLFEANAVFSVMGQEHHGRDAIVAFIAAAQPPERRGKHLLGQSVVDIDTDTGLAHAMTDYVFVSRELAITSAGRYHDTLRRGPDGEWRFTSREIRFL